MGVRTSEGCMSSRFFEKKYRGIFFLFPHMWVGPNSPMSGNQTCRNPQDQGIKHGQILRCEGIKPIKFPDIREFDIFEKTEVIFGDIKFPNVGEFDVSEKKI